MNTPHDPDTGTPAGIDHYQLLTGTDGEPVLLDEDALSWTLLARDELLHRTVRLKVLKASLTESPRAAEEFFAGARTEALGPNISRIIAGGGGGGQPYIVMEHSGEESGSALREPVICGREGARACGAAFTLLDALRRRRSFTSPEIVRILDQTAFAVDDAVRNNRPGLVLVPKAIGVLISGQVAASSASDLAAAPATRWQDFQLVIPRIGVPAEIPTDSEDLRAGYLGALARLCYELSSGRAPQQAGFGAVPGFLAPAAAAIRRAGARERGAFSSAAAFVDLLRTSAIAPHAVQLAGQPAGPPLRRLPMLRRRILPVATAAILIGILAAVALHRPPPKPDKHPPTPAELAAIDPPQPAVVTRPPPETGQPNR